MNLPIKGIQNPAVLSAPPYFEPLAIDATEMVSYKASILPAWRDRAAHIGNVSIDGFTGSNGIRPTYSTYDVTLQPEVAAYRAGDEESGSVSGTWAMGGGYHSFKQVLGADAAWATWSLGHVQSTSATYTRLDSRRVLSPPTFSYSRTYQSWWDTDGNIFNGAEPNGGYVALESAFFVGLKGGDTPYYGAPALYYLNDYYYLNAPVHSSSVPLSGWDWTWDKDEPLFDSSGVAARTACLWQRTVSDTWSYPQTINDFTEIKATMVASCTMNEMISVDLGVAPGWRVIKAELSLDNFWLPAGVALASGSGTDLEIIVNETSGTCTSINLSRYNITGYITNNTLSLNLAGTNYADVNAASTWQDTWLGALNCYLGDGWVDVTVARTSPSSTRIIPHTEQDPATQVESSFSIANLTSEFPAAHVFSRTHESIQFALHGLDAGLESILDMAGSAATNLTGLLTTNGSAVTVDLGDGLHGWLADRPLPASLIAMWKFHHAPISGTAIGQVLDPRVLPNFTATAIVPLREFGTGDTACVDVCIDMVEVGGASLSTASVELALFLNGTRISASQVNENINVSIAQARLIHAFQPDVPGHYQLEARLTCRNKDGSIATVDYAITEPDLRVKVFPPGGVVVFPIAGGRKEGFPIKADRVLLDPLVLDAGTSRVYVDMPWSHGLPALDFWRCTVAAPADCTNVTASADLQANRLWFERGTGPLVSGRYEIAITRPGLHVRVGLLANSSGALVSYMGGARNDASGGDITIARTSPFSWYFFNVSVVDASGGLPAIFGLATIAARIDLARVTGGELVGLGSFAFPLGTNSLLIPIENISSFGGIDYLVRDIDLHFALAFNASQGIYDENGTEIAYVLTVRRGIDLTICIGQRFFGAGPCTCTGATVSMHVDPPGIVDHLGTITLTSRDDAGRPVAVQVGLTIVRASWENDIINGTASLVRRRAIDTTPVSISGSTTLLVPTFAATCLPGEPFWISIGGLQTNDSFVDLACTSIQFTFTLPGQATGTVVNGSTLWFDVMRRPVTLLDLYVSCSIENGIPASTPSTPFTASISCIDVLSSSPAAGCWVEFLVDGVPVGIAVADATGIARLNGLYIPSVGTHVIIARLARIASGQVIDPVLAMTDIGSIEVYDANPPSNQTVVMIVRKSHVQLSVSTVPENAADIPATTAFAICPRILDLDAGAFATGKQVSIRVNGTSIAGGVIAGEWGVVDASVPGTYIVDLEFAGDEGFEPSAIQQVFRVHRTIAILGTTTGHAAPGENVTLCGRAWDVLVSAAIQGLPFSFEARCIVEGAAGYWFTIGTGMTSTAGQCSIQWIVPAWLAGQLVEYRIVTRPTGAQAIAYGCEASPSILIQVEKVRTSISIGIDVVVNPTTFEASCVVNASLAAIPSGNALAGATIVITIYGRPVGFPAFVPLRQVNATSGMPITIGTSGHDAIKVVAAFAGNSSHAGTIAESSRPCTIVTQLTIDGPATCVSGRNATYYVRLIAAGGMLVAGQEVTAEIGAWQGGTLKMLRVLRFTSGANATRIDVCFEMIGLYSITARYAGDGTFLPASSSANVTVVDKLATRISIEFPGGQEARVGVPMTITFRVVKDRDTSMMGAKIHVCIKNGPYYERLDVTLVDGVNSSFTWTPRETGDFTIDAWYPGNETTMRSKSAIDITVTELEIDVLASFFILVLGFIIFAAILKFTGVRTRQSKLLLVLVCAFPVDSAIHCWYAPVALADKTVPFRDMKADASALAGMAASMDSGLGSFPREAMAAVSPSLAQAQPIVAAAIVEAEAVAIAGLGTTVGDASVDTTPPEIRILSPGDACTITGDCLNVTARVTDACPGVEKAYFQVFRCGSTAGAVLSGFLECNETSGDPSIYRVAEDIGFFADGEYLVMVNATDLANNSASASCRFTLDHEIFVPGGAGNGDVDVPLQFLAEMLGILNVSFVPAVDGVFELAIARVDGGQAIAPRFQAVTAGQRVTVLVGIDPDFFAAGNYTLSMAVYTPNPYVQIREVHVLTVDRKAIVIDLQAEGLEKTRDGSVAYTDHDFDLVAVIAATASQGGSAPLPSGALGGKRVDFSVYMNDTWVLAGFAVTDARGVARLRFRFSAAFSWQAFTLGGRGRFVFNASFGGDQAFKPQAGQVIVDHRGIKTAVEAIRPGSVGATIQASPGDVIRLQARLTESKRPGEVRLIDGAPVDFFTVNPLTGNRTYIGSNRTVGGTGIATLAWLVNVLPNTYGIAFEYTGNSTHAPSAADVASRVNVSRSEVVIGFVGLGPEPVHVLSPGTDATVSVSVTSTANGRVASLRGASVTLSIINASGVAVDVGTTVTGPAGIARFVVDPETLLGGSATARVATLLASCEGTASRGPATASVPVLVAPSGIRVVMDPLTIIHGSACTVAARIERSGGMPLPAARIALLVEGAGHSAIVENVTMADGMVSFHVPEVARFNAGSYALTFTVLGNATLEGSRCVAVAGGIIILPAATSLGLVVPSSILAHEAIPIILHVSDEAGNPVVARVCVTIVALGSNDTCCAASGWTNASGEWSWSSAAMPAGLYTVRASVDGDGNRLAASASAAVEAKTIQAGLVVLLAGGDWLYPDDVALIVVRGTASAPWSQYVPVDVVVAGAGSNRSASVGMVLLEPGNPSASIDWRVPVSWPTEDVVVEARINETLSPYHGSASCVLHVRSRTRLDLSVLRANGTAIGSVLYTNEDVMVRARLREVDGDVVAGSIPLANGTLAGGNLDVTVKCTAHPAVTSTVNATGETPSWTRFSTCLADPNATSEAQSMRLSYAGDAYHDAAEAVLRFEVRKRPVTLAITNVARGSDGLHAAGRPAWLFHRSDAITVSGTLADDVNATRGAAQAGITGAIVQVLVDGRAVANCTTVDGGWFAGTFVPASFIGPTVFDVPDFCQAGYHVLSVAFAGDATYLPNATTRDEALQVVEYMHVDLAVRATEMSWSASDLLFTLTIRDEDFQVTTDAWLLVTIEKVSSSSTEVLYAQFLNSKAYSYQITTGGEYRVTIDRTSLCFANSSSSCNDSLVYWSQIEPSGSEVGGLDVESTAASARCAEWIPDCEALLVNPPCASSCTATVKITIVNLAIAWLPTILTTYANSMLKSAKAFKVRLALRLLAFIVDWLLQPEVYLPDLWNGIVAICVSAVVIWLLQKVMGKVGAYLAGKTGGAGALGKIGSVLGSFGAGAGGIGGPGGGSGGSGGGGNGGNGANGQNGGYAAYSSPAYSYGSPLPPATVYGASIMTSDATNGTNGTEGTTTGEMTSNSTGAGQGGEQAITSSTRSACAGTQSYTTGMEGSGGSGGLVPIAWLCVGVSPNSFAGGVGVSDAALEMSSPSAMSSSDVKDEFSGMLSIMRLVELGLLAIGALIVTWQVVHEAERPGDLFEGCLIRCLRSGVCAAFLTMTIICQVLAQIPGSEVAGSVLVMFVLGVTVGMLVGTAAVEVFKFFLESILRIDLDGLDCWARMLIDILLEMLRWSIMALVTYLFMASPGAIGSALLIAILKQLVVSLLKALLFEMLFWALEGVFTAAGEALMRAIGISGEQVGEQVCVTGQLPSPTTSPGQQPGGNNGSKGWDFAAKPWKIVGHGIPARYIMHGESHLRDWVKWVLLNYKISSNLERFERFKFDIELKIDKIIDIIKGLCNARIYTESYAMICAMLDLMCRGYTIVYAKLDILKVFEGGVYLGNGGLGSSAGPDIIAYKIENGVEKYAICEAKDSRRAHNDPWKPFLLKTGWQSSRYSICRLGDSNDFMSALKRVYPKAFDIIQRIRDPVSPASYDVYYVYGSISSEMVLDTSVTGVDINTVRGILDNRGSFEVILYELQNSQNQIPSSIPGTNGSPAKRSIFDRYPHLWKLLD